MDRCPECGSWACAATGRDLCITLNKPRKSIDKPPADTMLRQPPVKK